MQTLPATLPQPTTPATDGPHPRAATREAADELSGGREPGCLLEPGIRAIPLVAEGAGGRAMGGNRWRCNDRLGFFRQKATALEGFVAGQRMSRGNIIDLLLKRTLSLWTGWNVHSFISEKVCNIHSLISKKVLWTRHRTKQTGKIKP